MRSHDAGRALLALALAVTAATFPAADSLARSKKVAEPVYVPPPPPPPAGPVSLPSRLLADAAAYESYLARTTAITPVAFQNGAAVASALRVGSGYETKSLIRGAITYAAVAALQAPAFVADLRAAANSPENRAQMVNNLISNPAYVFVFRGADQAAGLAKQALAGPAMRLWAQGRIVKQSAYDVQHQAWSKQEIVDRDGRLAAAKASSSRPSDPALDQVAVLQSAASGASPMAIQAPAAQPPYTPFVARALQLAAVAAIGEATDEAYDRLSYLTDDMDTDTCLSMAKLNLFQCLAVSKPHYEDIFCIGQHIMLDTSACLIKSAGLATPPEAPPPVLTPVRAAAHRTQRASG